MIYNDTVREIAIETKVTLCDIDAAFAGCNDAELEDLLLPYPDQLHLSESGHSRYAAHIRPFIVSAIQKISPKPTI
jgi:lysophospholipase L1-like esterase